MINKIRGIKNTKFFLKNKFVFNENLGIFNFGTLNDEICFFSEQTKPQIKKQKNRKLKANDQKHRKKLTIARRKNNGFRSKDIKLF